MVTVIAFRKTGIAHSPGRVPARLSAATRRFRVAIQPEASTHAIVDHLAIHATPVFLAATHFAVTFAVRLTISADHVRMSGGGGACGSKNEGHDERCEMCDEFPIHGQTFH